MAMSWSGSIQEERRAGTTGNSADLRRQFPGYHMDVVLVVVGGLGTVTHRLVEDLRHLITAGKAVSQIEGMQRSVLCSSVRILRGHLSACELAA